MSEVMNSVEPVKMKATLAAGLDPRKCKDTLAILSHLFDLNNPAMAVAKIKEGRDKLKRNPIASTWSIQIKNNDAKDDYVRLSYNYSITLRMGGITAVESCNVNTEAEDYSNQNSKWTGRLKEVNADDIATFYREDTYKDLLVTECVAAFKQKIDSGEITEVKQIGDVYGVEFTYDSHQLGVITELYKTLKITKPWTVDNLLSLRKMDYK